MSKTVDITLAAAGTDTGPFNIYTNLDYVNAINTGVLKADLLSGFTTSAVPDAATSVRVTSTGTCTSYVDMNIVNPTGCVFSGGYTQVFSKITNNGNTPVQVILSKNSGAAFTATTIAANSSAEIYLSGTTFTNTDSLKVNIVAEANNIDVGISPTIFPNGGASLSYTSLTGNSSHSVIAIFNGDHAGWGVGVDMFWFNLTFTASAV